MINVLQKSCMTDMFRQNSPNQAKGISNLAHEIASDTLHILGHGVYMEYSSISNDVLDIILPCKGKAQIDLRSPWVKIICFAMVKMCICLMLLTVF